MLTNNKRQMHLYILVKKKKALLIGGPGKRLNIHAIFFAVLLLVKFVVVIEIKVFMSLSSHSIRNY